MAKLEPQKLMSGLNCFSGKKTFFWAITKPRGSDSKKSWKKLPTVVTFSKVTNFVFALYFCLILKSNWVVGNQVYYQQSLGKFP